MSRGPGVTAIIVRIGELEARARIAVVQRPAALQLPDTVLRVPEGERRHPLIRVSDARGNAIAGAPVRWSTGDGAVAEVDSADYVVGVSPGTSTLTVTFDQLRAVLPIEVVPVPSSITVIAGEEQRAAAGQPVGSPLVAQIVSRTGRPIAGVAAAFVARGGAGAVVPAVDTSDARGMVQAAWTLGAVPGRQQLAISVEGVAVSPVLTAEADPVPANTRVAVTQEGLTAVAGDTLSEPIVVRVTDSAGVALADLPVAWKPMDGGSITPLGDRTDSLGEAQARWTLGPRAGRQRLGVQVGNARLLPAITVAATALAGDARSIVILAGDRQTGTVGKALGRLVIVRALDRHGNPVPDAAIVVAHRAAGAYDSLVATDSAGQAGIRWRLGRSAGSQRMTLRLAREAEEVNAIAQALPAAPAKAVFVAV